MKKCFLLLCFYIVLSRCVSDENTLKYTTWSHYGGGPEMIRYSALDQVNTKNVSSLSPAWIYNSGDADLESNSQIQCNPIVIDGILYGVNPKMKLFAINASSGEELWVFDPLKDQIIENSSFFHNMQNVRGLAYWKGGNGEKRIFFTAGPKLICIDAGTGRPVTTFANQGYLPLHNDLGKDFSQYFIIATSPGVVYKDLIIIGTRVDEYPPAAPGHIRAYSVLTGELAWIFHTIPYPGEPGYDSWNDPEAYRYTGGANAWSGFSLDNQKGIVYTPLGSASYDFYGGKRLGNNLFANCLVALNADTGERIWHYQTIHHDVWDKDLPTPPALIKVKRGNRDIDAIAQPTKNGYLFILDRETGEPLYPIEEIAVDTRTLLEGEELAPTQPKPTIPEPFSRQNLNNNNLNPFISESEQSELKKVLMTYRKGNPFIPPGKNSSLVFPGFDGGAEWGGPAYDPETGIIYINNNEMAWVMTMTENPMPTGFTLPYFEAGEQLYQKYCVSCHRPDLSGRGDTPSLINIQDRLTHENVVGIIGSGQRMMPAFPMLSDEEKNILAHYIRKDIIKDKIYQWDPSREDSIHHVPYIMDGYNKFLTKEKLPAIDPPWGSLNAIDVNSGEYIWKTPLGNEPALAKIGITGTGAENYGGPVVTAGGLVFIAAAKDGYFRAFDKLSGDLLWEYKLPAPGFATPSVYLIDGIQYIVIACGGGKLGTISSDKYIAFSLPSK